MGGRANSNDLYTTNYICKNKDVVMKISFTLSFYDQMKLKAEHVLVCRHGHHAGGCAFSYMLFVNRIFVSLNQI